MKKFIFIFLLGSLTAPVFSQLTFPNADSVSNYLKGDWKFWRRCGGLIGTCQYPSTLGYSYDLTFKKIPNAPDSISYEVTKTGTAMQKGRAHITSSGSQWNISQMNGLTIANIFLFNSKTDTVNLSEVCSDCYSYTFARNKAIGVEEYPQENTKLFVYPSPASDEIWISVKNVPVVTNLVVYNNAGRIVKSFKDGSYQCDVSDLPQGIYFIKGSVKGNSVSGKFVKD